MKCSEFRSRADKHLVQSAMLVLASRFSYQRMTGSPSSSRSQFLFGMKNDASKNGCELSVRGKIRNQNSALEKAENL